MTNEPHIYVEQEKQLGGSGKGTHTYKVVKAINTVEYVIGSYITQALLREAIDLNILKVTITKGK